MRNITEFANTRTAITRVRNRSYICQSYMSLRRSACIIAGAMSGLLSWKTVWSVHILPSPTQQDAPLAKLDNVIFRRSRRENVTISKDVSVRILNYAFRSTTHSLLLVAFFLDLVLPLFLLLSFFPYSYMHLSHFFTILSRLQDDVF